MIQTNDHSMIVPGYKGISYYAGIDTISTSQNDNSAQIRVWTETNKDKGFSLVDWESTGNNREDSGYLGGEWGLHYKDTPRPDANGNANAQPVPPHHNCLKITEAKPFQSDGNMKQKAGKANEMGMCFSLYTTKTNGLFNRNFPTKHQ